MKFLQPPDWPRAKGYSNGIATRGELVFVAGIVGWNAQEQFETDDFAGQARQCFANITAILAEAGAKPEHVVRMTWFVGDTDEYLASGKEIGAAYREYFGRHYPVMAVIGVRGFIEDGAKLEIETTAVIPD
ncbi:MAG: RidA family protein [Alphaproteobacteria bacterium]|nr:RidA family protein [Alphaproteobacteria bacterium]MDP6563502.1 RidA family protein [Alphaproteobacteria bacterium]MDP6812688.1 RidA family protein [Alphaproteobacteria bacterium]